MFRWSAQIGRAECRHVLYRSPTTMTVFLMVLVIVMTLAGSICTAGIRGRRGKVDELACFFMQCLQTVCAPAGCCS